MQIDHNMIDYNYITSNPTADLSLQNFKSHRLHFFELRTPFLMIISTSNKKENHYSFHQFSFDGVFYHILNDKERDKILTRPQHLHSYIEVMYVLSGEVINHIEDKKFTYHAGDCVIMNRNIQHKETGDFQIVLLALQEGFISNLISEEILTYKKISTDYSHYIQSQIIKMLQATYTEDSQYQQIYFDCIPVGQPELVLGQIHTIIHSIMQELSSCNPGSVYMTKGYIQKFFSILCDPEKYNVKANSSTLSKQNYIFKKIEHILEAKHGKISRNEVAQLLHYNEEYLNRIVKQVTGKTFSHFRQSIVLQEAKRLLSDTDLSIAKIMETLELSNKSSFYQLFKKEFGVTPSEYRQHCKQ